MTSGLGKLFEEEGIAGGLLLMGLLCLFLFQNDRNGFLPGHHGYLSSHGLALSSNLSARHRFLMFNSARCEPDGSVVFDVYNRFPAGTFLAVKLVTWPVRQSLGLTIFAAHQLMNMFLAAAAVAAYLSLRRFGATPWMALGSTLLSFSSYTCLYYNDMVFNDVPALFGMLLTLHGLLVFNQERAMPQLLVKIALALALGWQAYALLAPFLMLSIGQLVFKWDAVQRDRLLAVGVFAAAAGSLVLAVQIANEGAVIGGNLADLPSVRSALWRLGAASAERDEPFGALLSWDAFAWEQLGRMGRMCVPHSLSPVSLDAAGHVRLGLLALFVALATAAATRNRVLALSLVLSGLCWAVPLKRFVQMHDFQSLFYIGLPLWCWYGLTSLAHAAWRPSAVAIGCVAVLVFGSSTARLNLLKSTDAIEANRVTAEFQRIADRVGVGRSVYVSGAFERMGGAQHAVSFFLSGNTFESRLERSDYLITEAPINGLMSFTPDNRTIHLYAGGKIPIVLEIFRREKRASFLPGAPRPQQP